MVETDQKLNFDILCLSLTKFLLHLRHLLYCVSSRKNTGGVTFGVFLRRYHSGVGTPLSCWKWPTWERGKRAACAGVEYILWKLFRDKQINAGKFYGIHKRNDFFLASTIWSPGNSCCVRRNHLFFERIRSQTEFGESALFDPPSEKLSRMCCHGENYWAFKAIYWNKLWWKGNCYWFTFCRSPHK